MSAAAVPAAPPVVPAQGFAELTIEVRDLEAAGHPFRGAVEHEGGDVQQVDPSS
jgi:hypothetical protein